ncbi:MAG TPA: type 1 glutamine amidotransferase [bacterium]|nr:type 1 glutamine amidotransferase [bacterium]
MSIRLCIINGYPKPNREVLTRAGMCGADELYLRVLKKLVPDARVETLFIADLDTSLPNARQAEGYDGFIWTGSNLTIYEDDPRVVRQIEFARQIFAIGRPQFGSCWGLQMAAVAAGGEVRKNPHGREMGFARKLRLTAEGRRHPMYEGKPDVFDGFISHLDEVTRLPNGGVLLATNEHTRVQALEVKSGSGVFWATQYHPEYELAEMARLIVARADPLIKEGFFADRAALEAKVQRMETLASDPSRKDLRWDVAVGDDILDDRIRQCELRNWVRKMVMPTAPAGKH